MCLPLRVERVGLRRFVLLPDLDLVGQAGVVEREVNRAGDCFGRGIVEDGEAFLWQVRIDVQDAVQVAGVGAA